MRIMRSDKLYVAIDFEPHRITMHIAPPKIANDYPNRPLECQFAIEPGFQRLAHQARAAGWSGSEVAAALIDLAHNHMRGIIADGQLLAGFAHAEPALSAESKDIEDIEDIEASAAEDVDRIERETRDKT